MLVAGSVRGHYISDCVSVRVEVRVSVKVRVRVQRELGLDCG